MAERSSLAVQAQQEHRVLRILYLGRGKMVAKERHIEVYEFDGTYIDAFCRRARERRTFRLDRIISLELLEDRFVPDLHVMDAIDRAGWANRSSNWRRQKAAAIEEPRAVPAPVPLAQPSPQPSPVTPPAAYRPPSYSSGFLAKVAAAIILGIVGLSTVLSGGSSRSTRYTYSTPSYSSAPSPSYSSYSSSVSSASRDMSPARTEKTEHYGRTYLPNTLKDADFRTESEGGKPFVAENGSYYGEPNANGVPKTVYVNGYYRSDGTYVRGYYRSAPYSNPPSIKSSTPKTGSTSTFHTPKLPTIRSSGGSHGRGR